MQLRITGTRSCVSGEKQHGIICEPRDLQIGGFPLPPFLGRKYPAPAPPEMWFTPGKNRMRLMRSRTAPFTGLPRSIRTLHHWRMPATRGNGRYCAVGRVKTKYPLATPLAIAGKLFAFYALDRLSGLSRGTTRCYLSAVASRSQEPTTRSRVGCIWCPNWKMVVTLASSAGVTVPQVAGRFQVEIRKFFYL
jgi:hypothetical protein